MGRVNDLLKPVVALLVVIGALVAVDLASDVREGVEWGHALIEASVIALTAAGAVWLLVQMRAERVALESALRAAHQERAQASASAAQWQAAAAQAARGFAEAVDAEFVRWGLTGAERDVALLLLKGMSLKEIATARGVSERTVRQQATVVYAKAGVTGRTELASYFLDVLK